MLQDNIVSNDLSNKILTECKSYWSNALERRISYLPHAPLLKFAAGDGVCAWDEEIAVLKDLVVSVQTRRNALVPGCSLPPEILSRIFVYVKLLCSSSRCSCTGMSNSWLNITQVCRIWRNVALGCGALWADLSTDSTQPWDTFLQRSRSHPLSIRAKLPQDSENNVLSATDIGYCQLIAEHLHQVRNLRFESSKSELLTSLISNTIPKPDFLELDLRFTSRSGSEPILLLSSFLKTVPALQKLRLFGILLPWDAVYSNLRVLLITVPRDTSADIRTLPSDPDRILRCLQHMPRLEALQLDFSLDSIPALSSTATVVLPHLKEIGMFGTSQACLDVWRSIRPHSHANITILFSAAGSSPPPEILMQEALSILSVHLKSPDSPKFAQVRIHGDRASSNRLVMEVARPADAINPKRGCRENARIELVFRSSYGALATCCAMIPLHHTKHLSLYECDLTPEDCTQLLSSAQSVEEITLAISSSDSLQAFCTALSPTSRVNCSQRGALKRRLPVPHLHSLHLGFVFFGDRARAYLSPMSYLVQMFKARRSALCALQTFSIRHSSIRESQIKRLGQIVPNIQCERDHNLYFDDEPEGENRKNNGDPGDGDGSDADSDVDN